MKRDLVANDDANLPDLQAARRFLEDGEEFTLTSHVNSDGDGIGGCLALGGLLRQMGKRTFVLLPEAPDTRYDFLDGWETVRQVEGPPFPQLGHVIVIDCPSLARIGPVEACLSSGSRILNIDHHPDNRRFGQANWVSAAASSSSELVYHLAAGMGLEIDAVAATQIYTGMLFDTGGFRFSLTTPTTLEVAAALAHRGIRLHDIADRVFGNKNFSEVKQLGKAIESLALHLDGRVAAMQLGYEDLRTGEPEEVVNYGLLVKGVEVAILLREHEPNQHRVSLRSRDGVDVSRIAARFGGGGHARAAGCRLAGRREDVEGELLAAIAKDLPARSPEIRGGAGAHSKGEVAGCI
jgi:bifunctional oligoribonuclease and PAP phosphatase NrnA